MAKINNGDVFDISQTINGVSKFLWFNDKWHYFEERMTREYEYDQKELTDLVKNINETEDIKFLGNVLEKQFTEEDMIKAIKLATTSKYDHKLEFFSEEEIIEQLKLAKTK